MRPQCVLCYSNRDCGQGLFHIYWWLGGRPGRPGGCPDDFSKCFIASHLSLAMVLVIVWSEKTFAGLRWDGRCLLSWFPTHSGFDMFVKVSALPKCLTWVSHTLGLSPAHAPWMLTCLSDTGASLTAQMDTPASTPSLTTLSSSCNSAGRLSEACAFHPWSGKVFIYLVNPKVKWVGR